ncbi:Hypothetical predicted protein, partial [Prunus dulcis]
AWIDCEPFECRGIEIDRGGGGEKKLRKCVDGERGGGDSRKGGRFFRDGGDEYVGERTKWGRRREGSVGRRV